MPFTATCEWCGKETAFHDDEKDADLLLCTDCTVKFQERKVTLEIMSGEFTPAGAERPENEDEEETDDEDEEGGDKADPPVA